MLFFNWQKIILFISGGIVVWLASKYLLPLILPFIAALILALAAEPLVCAIENRFRMRRSAASGIGITAILGLLLLITVLFGTLLFHWMSNLTVTAPALLSTIEQSLSALHSYLNGLCEKVPDGLGTLLTAFVEDLFADGTLILQQAFQKLISMATGAVSNLPRQAINIGTFLIAGFMFSAKLPKIKVYLSRKLPAKKTNALLQTAQKIKHSLLGWLLAQIKLIGLTFLVLCIGFLLLRITPAPLWAFLIALIDALPILGTGTILIPWSILCLIRGNVIRGIALAAIYVIAMLLRSILEPRLVGKQLGLDPLVTLLTIYVGYRLWGFAGMILAPVLAVTALQILSQGKQQ